MAKDNSSNLMQALVAKLYATITGDDVDIKMPRNKFVTWFLPGMPFEPQDFRFCMRGFNGETAEEIKENYHQAWVLSKLLNFVPDVSTEFVDFDHMQQTLFSTTQDSINSIYKDILNYSRVLNNELSDTEKAKLQKFRDLMQVEVEEVDILTDEKKIVTKPGKLTLAYTAKMMDYIEAADEYMNLKIDAQSATGDDPEAKRRVHAWAAKSKFVRNKMEAAYQAWVSQGYKNEYEIINAYIDQVTRKNLVLYKQDLIRKFEASRMTSPDDGDFYYTTLLPGGFAASPGWTRFNFNESDYETHHDKKVSKWSAGGGLNFGLFSFGAKAGGDKTEVSDDQKAANFSASLEFTQAQIFRAGFEPGFLSMRSWDLDKAWHLTYDKEVSDGAEKPVGRLVAYPVSALFVRNVQLMNSEWERHSDFMKKSLSAGGSVGYGPFRVGGSYSTGRESRDMKYHMEGGRLTIPGMQLVGFINNIVPKCPNLNPEITPAQLVGGG